MTQIQHTHPHHAAVAGKGNVVGRAVAFLYGLAAYAVFFIAFLYAIGFVSGLVVPKTIDSGATVPAIEAAIVNLLLMSLFAVQHSVMARPRSSAPPMCCSQASRSCCCSGSGARSRRWCGRSAIRRWRWR
jgi:protein-S-isoprenylcysteine O-methyltransferase Ste14